MSGAAPAQGRLMRASAPTCHFRRLLREPDFGFLSPPAGSDPGIAQTATAFQNSPLAEGALRDDKKSRRCLGLRVRVRPNSAAKGMMMCPHDTNPAQSSVIGINRAPTACAWVAVGRLLVVRLRL